MVVDSVSNHASVRLFARSAHEHARSGHYHRLWTGRHGGLLPEDLDPAADVAE